MLYLNIQTPEESTEQGRETLLLSTPFLHILLLGGLQGNGILCALPDMSMGKINTGGATPNLKT